MIFECSCSCGFSHRLYDCVNVYSNYVYTHTAIIQFRKCDISTSAIHVLWRSYFTPLLLTWIDSNIFVFLCKSSGDQCYTILRYMRIRNKIFGNYFYYLLYKNLGHDTLWALYLLTSRKLIGTQRKGVMAQTPLYQNHGCNNNGWMVNHQVTTTLMMPYYDSRLNEYCLPTIIELTLTSDQWSVLAWICKVLTWKPIEQQLQPLDMTDFITKQ